jgi:catechol 2,3-dioxygenase-like lactoylglutathione lyase family enzyme
MPAQGGAPRRGECHLPARARVCPDPGDLHVTSLGKCRRTPGTALAPRVDPAHHRPPYSASVLDRLHHVQLAMPRGEEHAARKFFVGVLGMTELEKPAVLAARGGAWFRGGAVELHLGVEEPYRPARKAHPGVLVKDLDELVDRLTSNDIHVTWDDELPGFRRIYVHDPFGNRLEFLQPSQRPTAR